MSLEVPRPTVCNFCGKPATNQERDSYVHYELCDECEKSPRIQQLLKQCDADDEYCDKMDT